MTNDYSLMSHESCVNAPEHLIFLNGQIVQPAEPIKFNPLKLRELQRTASQFDWSRTQELFFFLPLVP